MVKARKSISYQLWQVVSKTTYWTLHHDGMELAGYLTFLGMLSLFPFLVFLISLAGFVGELDKGGQFVTLLTTYMPKDFIQSLQPRIDEIVSGPPQGLMTLAIVGTLWTSSSAVEGLRMVLNRAHNVGTPPSYVWRRVISILQLILLSVLIIIAMLFMTVIPVIWGWLEKRFALTGLLSPGFTYLRYGLSFGTFFAAVATSYYILPNIQQRWKVVAPGALLVVIIWMIAAEVFGFYLSIFNQLDLVYGSLAGLIVSMLFFYILAVIYIAGAEFNHQFAGFMGWHVTEKVKNSKKSPKMAI